MKPLVRRILVFEGIYAAAVAALLLGVYVGIPSQGEGNLAAWAVMFASVPPVMLFGVAGVSLESAWSTYAGRFGIVAFYAIIAALLAMVFRGKSE